MAIELQQPELYCPKCGELIPEKFEHGGHKVPLLACAACLPLAPTDLPPRKRKEKPGIGSLLDDVPALFIGRHGT